MGEVYLQVTFAIIAVLALSSNAAFCIVLLRDRRLLNSTCNVLLFSLAVTDMITGFSLLITPAYVVEPSRFTVPGGVTGDFFCRIIYSQCFVFTLGIVSVYTLTFMAVERWYAIARPHQYKNVFTSNRKYMYVALVWVISCLLNAPHALEMELATIPNGTEPTCIWVTAITSEKGRLAVAVLEFLFKFLSPVAVTCATFIHLQSTIRKPGCQFLRRNGKAGVRLLRMCTITAFALAACWAPNQLYYLLFKFHLCQLNVPAHHVTVILCMFNSCINPWIYCATNRTYRRKFASLARSCCRGAQINCDATTSASGIAQDISTATGDEKPTMSTSDRPASIGKYKYTHENEAMEMTEATKIECEVSAGIEVGISDKGNLVSSENEAKENHKADEVVLRDIESPSIEDTRN